MFKPLILLLTLTLTTTLPNPAPYIHQQGRPLNIAHRGLCSILPQNTLQAFSAALYQGADFIELDVVYTKQKQLLVMHDPFLTRITNVKEKEEFADRYSMRKYAGKDRTDWWTDQFYLYELKRLGIKQDQAPGRLKIFDYKFTFPTLAQVIEMVIAFNNQHNGKRNPDGRLAGILIQAKDGQMYRDLYNIQIAKDILDLLKKYNIQTITKSIQNKCLIYLHSFDYGSIKYWASNTQLPRNYLVGKSNTYNLTDVNLYATGMGFQDTLMWDYSTASPKSDFGVMRELGMLVHIWTFKDDAKIFFNASSNLEGYRVAQDVMKLDGVITQFSDVYAPVAQMLIKEAKKGNEVKRKVMAKEKKEEKTNKRKKHELPGYRGFRKVIATP